MNMTRDPAVADLVDWVVSGAPEPPEFPRHNSGPGHSRRGRLLIPLVVAAVLVVGFAVFWARQNTGKASGPSVAVPGTDAKPAPVRETAGATLSHADNLVIQTIMHLESLRKNVTVNPRAIQVVGADPVVIEQDSTVPSVSGAAGCLIIATTAAEGPAEGSCTKPGKAGTELVLVSAANRQVWYVGWTQVPAGTSYVQVSTSKSVTTQVPLDGAAYITISGTLHDVTADPPVARAYDATGQQIGEATVSEEEIDLGQRS